jgi:hypothetical protein
MSEQTVTINKRTFQVEVTGNSDYPYRLIGARTSYALLRIKDIRGGAIVATDNLSVIDEATARHAFNNARFSDRDGALVRL